MQNQPDFYQKSINSPNKLPQTRKHKKPDVLSTKYPQQFMPRPAIKRI
jgi:hypothetical protein